MSRAGLNWRHDVAIDAVRALTPSSLLDVACGNGWLLQATAETIPFSVGLERLLPSLDPTGVRMVIADSDELPFAADAFDVTVIRNALHHFGDPRRALAEAARVTRRSIVITEPWFDPTLPSQRRSDRIERWARRQEERAGRVHRPNLSAGEIEALLPTSPRLITLEHRLRLEDKPLDAWTDKIADVLNTIPKEDSAWSELDVLRREIDRVGPATAEGMLLLRVDV